MTVEYFNRWNLSANRSQTSFKVSADRGPPIKTKDNTEYTIPPPRVSWVPHPHLAPPGMMGSRLAREAKQYIDDKRERGELTPDKKPFKPWAHANDRERSR